MLIEAFKRAFVKIFHSQYRHAFITMGDPAAPEGIPLGERGMTPFLDNPMYFFDILESNSGFQLNRLIPQ